METTVLVLCANDRCLAPAASTILRTALQAHGEWQVQVVSAGIRAEVGAGWCPQMSAQLTKDHDLIMRPHRAQQVTAELARAADLVLVSERKYRGSTRLLDAGSADHTFTFLEAAILAKEALARTVSEGAAPSLEGAVQSGTGRLGTRERLLWLLEEMNAVRGLVALPPEEPRGWRRRFGKSVEVVGHDILDPHGDRGSHRKAAPAVRDALDSFAASLAAASPRTVPA
ncbi:arsenate reductase/protein-tyrosine-phosphatase family protein [Pedococcus sp. P5_B7]